MAEILRTPRTNQIKEIKAWIIANQISQFIAEDLTSDEKAQNKEIKNQTGQNLCNVLFSLGRDFLDDKDEMEIACRDTSVTMWVYSALNKLLTPYGSKSNEIREKLIKDLKKHWFIFTTKRITNYVWWPTEWIVLLLKKINN